MGAKKTLDLSKYAGKWVAILDDEVIAWGDTLKDIAKYVTRKSSDKTPQSKIPAAFKVPPKGEGPYVI